MRLIIAGRQHDCFDHAEWSLRQGHESRYLEVDAIDDDMLSWCDDLVSLHDIRQVEVEALRERRGLPTRGLAAVATLSEKTRFKAHPAVAPFVARHVELDPDTAPDDAVSAITAALDYPVVVKPSNGFYSAGVVRADDDDALRRAYILARRVCKTLPVRGIAPRVIAEAYLDGDEFAIDGFIDGDQVHPLLLHRKRPALQGPTFHEVAYLSEPFDRARGRAAHDILQRIIAGVGLRNSAFHAEFRRDAAGRLHILELAPRLAGGGATTRHLLAASTGLDAYAILHSLGRAPLNVCPTSRGCGLEYDFAAPRSGRLINASALAQACRDRGATAVLTYREDGDFVMGPPANVDAVLIAYFACETLNDALSLFEDLHAHCTVQTEIS